MPDIDTYMTEIGDPIVVTTHPRSGTHLMIDLLRKQFAPCKGWLHFGETLHHLYLNLDDLSTIKQRELPIDEAIDILKRPDRPIVKTHALPSFNSFKEDGKRLAHALLDQGTTLHVVRDGRDVMCSAHAWYRDLTGNHDLPLADFLRQKQGSVSRVRFWADFVTRWADQPDVLVMRFEDVVSDTEAVVAKLGEVLGMNPLYETPLLPERLSKGGRLADYWRRLTRDHESTAILGRPNQQAPLDWREAFTDEDRQFFWDEAGPVLERFGYQHDASWIHNSA